MLALLRDLVAHKGHANAALLSSIHQSPVAAADPDVCQLLHHVLVANRFWTLSILGLPFNAEVEVQGSRALPALVDGFRRAQELESSWLERASEADLARPIEGPLVPGGRCTVAQAMTQVCLHSQGHRAQCATLLRRLGVAPPASDFILWIVHRNPAEWP
jgi:uncharacterized damage-inducible protein DinB